MSTSNAPSREALHAAAEWLLAGPQHLASGTIRLQVSGGVVTTLDGQTVIGPDGLTQTTAAGTNVTPWATTVAAMGLAAGIEPSVPQGLYQDHAALGVDDPLTVDEASARRLLAWFGIGAEGLNGFSPTVSPVLWPEHFDLAIAVDEVNYGVSLGDAHHESPYAYVGPWQQRDGDFWNAPFGAVRAADDLPDAREVAAFFAEGARQAAGAGARG